MEQAPEDQIEHREERHRFDDRPHVAERGARVLELEVGLCDDDQRPHQRPRPRGGWTIAVGGERGGRATAAFQIGD